MKPGSIIVSALAGAAAIAACTGIDTGKKGDKPVAAVSGQVGGLTGVQIQFDGSPSTADGDGFLVAWEWDFGDGSTATGETVSHTYSSAASFNASLTVRDNQQRTDLHEFVVEVEPLSSLAGTWILFSTPASAICAGPGYALGFPATNLNIMVAGSSMTADPSGSLTNLAGGFDAQGRLHLNGTATSTTLACGAANITSVTEALNVVLTNGNGNFAGSYSVLLNWDDLFCNCTKVFQVSGSHN